MASNSRSPEEVSVCPPIHGLVPLRSNRTLVLLLVLVLGFMFGLLVDVVTSCLLKVVLLDNLEVVRLVSPVLLWEEDVKVDFDGRDRGDGRAARRKEELIVFLFVWSSLGHSCMCGCQIDVSLGLCLVV